MSDSIKKIASLINTQKNFQEAISEGTCDHFGDLDQRHTQLGNATLRSLIYKIKQNRLPVILAIRRDPIFPSSYRFSYYNKHSDRAENLICNLCPYLFYTFLSDAAIDSDYLISLGTRDAQNEVEESSWKQKERLVWSKFEIEAEMMEVERQHLITNGIIAPDAPIRDPTDDLEAVLKEGDDIGTIRSGGDTIASNMTAGTQRSAASVGTADTTNNLAKENADLKAMLHIIRKEAADMMLEQAQAMSRQSKADAAARAKADAAARAKAKPPAPVTPGNASASQPKID